jgi:alanine racemase
VSRSLFTLDLGAIRANVRRLLEVDAAAASLEAGATALCVASVPEALELRARLPESRIVVLGPGVAAQARQARLELVAGVEPIPEGVPVHLKLDTGMGRWGLSELPAPGRDVVGLMSHFAASDSDEAFTRLQLERFLEATAPYTGITRHIANSAATLSLPEARLDAVRCGITVYGISPFGDGPGAHGLVPALRWTSELARVFRLRPGESTGYGRTFVATEPTWIGIVPVGYADGFRRDMTGAEVLVAGERCRVVGTVSMDALAVRIERELRVGEEVVLLGDGITAEGHARVAGTIAYEIVCGLNTREPRARREVVA